MKGLWLAICILVMTISLVVRGGLAAQQARVERANADEALAVARTQAGQLMRLVSVPARVASGTPQTDGSALVSAALQKAGLGVSVFRDVIAEGDLPATAGYVRRTLRITLDPVEPAQIGRFLQAWMGSQPLWTVNRIDLTRVASPVDRSSAYRATVSVACVFVKDERP